MSTGQPGNHLCKLATTRLLLPLLSLACVAFASSISPRQPAFQSLFAHHRRLGLIHQHQHQQQQAHAHFQARRSHQPHLPWRTAAAVAVAPSLREGEQEATASLPPVLLQRRSSASALAAKLAALKGGANGAKQANGDASLWNLPNILTLMRVFAIPVLVGVFYVDAAWRNLACTVLFVFAAMTDWLDGYLARRMNLSSPLGAFLDPVADKLMVATALVLMADRMDSPWVTVSTAIIICREIGVSALREWMASMNQRDTVAVGWWGKVKTATQMVALSVLLYVQPPFPKAVDAVVAQRLLDVGVALLSFSAFLTVTSAVGYVKAAWPALTGKAKK